MAVDGGGDGEVGRCGLGMGIGIGMGMGWGGKYRQFVDRVFLHSERGRGSIIVNFVIVFSWWQSSSCPSRVSAPEAVAGGQLSSIL